MMASSIRQETLGTFQIAGVQHRYIDLPRLLGSASPKVPTVLRLLLENAVRGCTPEQSQKAVGDIRGWLDRGSSAETIEFRPIRILMEDTTCTPAFVDIAAMRDAISAAGGDPKALNPVLPIDASIDHSIAVDHFAKPGSAALNARNDFSRNHERYSFLRWAAAELNGVRIHPPGTGIMHTINVEQLATVVSPLNQDGFDWAVPDSLVGTDSHTPLVNGIGVLGWGVGGLEAQATMFGAPVVLRIPNVVGVRLGGSLKPGILAMDLALEVTHRLRSRQVSGQFVEYFGPGVSTLSAGERCVVASMAPEYGATTGYFPTDDRTLDYLRTIGRSEASIELIEKFMRATGLWFDPNVEPRYSEVVDIDLGTIGRRIAGPRRPQDIVHYGHTAAALAKYPFEPSQSDSLLPKYPIAIAAITSCTNTTDPALLIAAGLVARKARQLGLKVPSWTKTSLGPGSPAAAEYLSRAGLLDDLAAVGFEIVGFGCTTCLGNSGALTEEIERAIDARAVKPVAVLSGNRNFPGRVHPDLDLSFIMSPPLVIAFALSGDAEVDLDGSPVQTAPSGAPVFLRELWPTSDEIIASLNVAGDPSDYGRAFSAATRDSAWNSIDHPHGALFPWDANSTVLTSPPYVTTASECQLGQYSAYPLLVVGDDVTTDHIAPGSAIPSDSAVADFLIGKGVKRGDLGVFSSRRGNWEVMVRATFHNNSLINLLYPSAPVAQTIHAPTGHVMPIHEAAERYKGEGNPVVLVAGRRYGSGSSRDWAAKGPRLLGIRAVLAVGIERIHRSNLIGMGILPLLIPESAHPTELAIQPGDRIEIDAPRQSLRPSSRVAVRLVRTNGRVEEIAAIAAIETQLEVDLLEKGGIIPAILSKYLQGQQPTC
jgi:aconitate hydratase